MPTTKPHCTNTTDSVDEKTAKELGLLRPDWSIWGRRICTACGNGVFPNKDGSLRKHIAKRMSP